MLSSRTKQVNSYGRRGSRIVNVYDYDFGTRNHTELVSAKQENNLPESQKGTKDCPILVNSCVSAQDSPPLQKKKPKKSPKIAKVGFTTAKTKPSFRPPLGSIAPNAPGSPALPPSLRTARRSIAIKSSPLVAHSSVVSVDIVILDAQGRRVSQEHRVSRENVRANVLAPAPSKKKNMLPRCPTVQKEEDAIVVTSDSEEDTPIVRPRRKVQTKVKPIIISDSEEDSDSEFEIKEADTSIEDATPRFRRPVHRTRSNVIRSPSPTPSLSPSPPLPAAPVIAAVAKPHEVRQPVPTTHNPTLPSQRARPPSLAPFSSLPDLEETKPGQSRSKPRQLTPIRRRPGRSSLFPAPPSPPSPTTPSDFDADASFDFGQLALSPRALAEVQQLEAASLHSVPAYIQPLLEECAQTTPHEFSAFIDMFPFDPIVRLRDSLQTGSPRFQKIGEASFSEVFGIGDVVLKIVPLRDEERDDAGVSSWTLDAESPPPSDAKDVQKEIIVTRAMGATCSGFVELLRAYVVRGKYPSLLLDLWDEYEARKGSESIRPDNFTVSQLYAIIVLPNGGPDLEAYTFSTPTKTGWRQACSIFWQVTRTLAGAEELVRFEHRDLHWGQILVKDVPSQSAPPGRRSAKTRLPMDSAGHGVVVTVIDLGLSRIDSHDTSGAGVHWTPFDEEVFEGTGDYQFDVYRMMRAHNRNRWREYRPLTNVMWLHYLVLKLLQSKRLRPPPAPRKTATAPSTGFTERECYECLKEVEGILAQCLAGIDAPEASRKRSAGRSRKTAAPPVKAIQGLQSASELLGLAAARGWVS